MEILHNRVRIFVDSNDSDVDDDDLGGRFVVKIPQVGQYMQQHKKKLTYHAIAWCKVQQLDVERKS